MLVFVALWAHESHATRQNNLTYEIEDYSPRAHKILKDHGESALFKISLYDVNAFLPWREPIKRVSTRFFARRFSPVRPIRKFIRMGIYKKRPLSKYSDAKDFFASCHEGVPHTYVVLKNKLIFAESTSSPLQEKYRDKFSKHYLISDLKQSVRYAGEFKVYKNSRDQIVVVFDNASGTFRPASEHLPHLQGLLEHNFSEHGLTFVVRSYDQVIDPEQYFENELNDSI